MLETFRVLFLPLREILSYLFPENRIVLFFSLFNEVQSCRPLSVHTFWGLAPEFGFKHVMEYSTTETSMYEKCGGKCCIFFSFLLNLEFVRVIANSVVGVCVSFRLSYLNLIWFWSFISRSSRDVDDSFRSLTTCFRPCRACPGLARRFAGLIEYAERLCPYTFATPGYDQRYHYRGPWVCFSLFWFPIVLCSEIRAVFLLTFFLFQSRFGGFNCFKDFRRR